MKKIILSISCLLLIIGLCSCGGGGGMFAQPSPTPVPEIDPSAIITADDVAQIAGYTPVTDGVKNDGTSKTIIYRSEPIGQRDTVTVKLTQFSDALPYEQIFAKYEQDKAKRSTAELVGSVGQETYIAFPTVHIYDRGCLVEITAGSGSDDAQRNLLKSFAMTAAGRIEAIIPEYKAQK